MGQSLLPLDVPFDRGKAPSPSQTRPHADAELRSISSLNVPTPAIEVAHGLPEFQSRIGKFLCRGGQDALAFSEKGKELVSLHGFAQSEKGFKNVTGIGQSHSLAIPEPGPCM
ncbi:hypothetical protein [uncultured Lamprocystis sp.]|uniref:hypothetical protein n=1 Tax=uncultured Lamprocystis sp. TaxID=543132 RepID=UPI002600D7A6|nr:hypothetical protein [uncultured Lamprocystis sp.]